jgi:outer membrane protein assembly factor BamB
MVSFRALRTSCLAAALAAGAVATGSTQSRRAPEWPSFRGTNAAGIAQGQSLPASWNGETGEAIRWKVEIPGLAHSSPIVAGDLIFVTTAISSRPDATFQKGLYGAGTASEDVTPHRFVVMAIDRATGKTRWQQTAFEGAPKQKRHIKSTYASATPATDGEIVVASFGSNGLHAYDVRGRKLWQVDLGRLDVGAYDLPEYEWGSASSPIIYKDLVIIQCDQQKGSYLLAVNRKTGKTVWKTMREELPSWGTPTVYESRTPGRVPELVTNASKFIRGYDPMTGRELWRLGGSSNITAPTPIFTDDYLIVASGRRDEKPIFAIRPGARGEITLGTGQTANASVAWSKRGRGPYMPTPVIFGGIVYVLNNDGIFDAYALDTGAEIYRERIPHHGSGFSASPVISDGRIILSSEDGDMFVVTPGPAFKVAAANPMGESLMATPALAGDAMYVRGERHLFAIGQAARRR